MHSLLEVREAGKTGFAPISNGCSSHHKLTRAELIRTCVSVMPSVIWDGQRVCFAADRVSYGRWRASPSWRSSSACSMKRRPRKRTTVREQGFMSGYLQRRNGQISLGSRVQGIEQGLSVNAWSCYELHEVVMSYSVTEQQTH